jgi:PAS domain S-box-containing protein
LDPDEAIAQTRLNAPWAAYQFKTSAFLPNRRSNGHVALTNTGRGEWIFRSPKPKVMALIATAGRHKDRDKISLQCNLSKMLRKRIAMAATPGRKSGSLTSAPPDRQESAIAIAVVGLSAITLACLTPFARIPLTPVAAFIPAYESALAIIDLITAVLLFNQAGRSGSLAVLVLACGYFFSSLIIVPHALSFPGVFAPQGLLGAGPQTTAWLYCFWHGGFALFVLAYALLARRGHGLDLILQGSNAFLAIGIVTTIALVLAATLLAINREHSLTPIMNGNDYSMLVTKGISPSICGFSLVALALVWPRRKISTLDLWLSVVMCAWLCDVILSAIVGSSRFDLGWYGGRSFGLLAASFLLIMLLTEFNELYDRVAQSELHRTTALFEAVINMTPDLVFVKDLQSKALLRNPAALFGKTWEEVEGRKEAEWHQDPREAEQVVANDRKVIEAGTSMQFVEQFTTLRGVRTLLSTKSPLFDEDGKIVGTIGVSTDITERENRAKHVEFIMRELSHRSKNLLMIIQAVARQSIRQSSGLDDFERQFNERLASLARLHDLLIQEEWRGASLRAITQTQVGPFAGNRVKIEGAEILLKPDIAQVISMVLHELATNASKYGALSNAVGNVVVLWDCVGDQRNRLSLRWQETDGPAVLQPQRRGFGTVVLERMALQIPDASASLKFLTTGVVWYLEAPLESFVSSATPSLENGPTVGTVPVRGPS